MASRNSVSNDEGPVMGLEFRGRVTFPGQQLARTKSGTWPKLSWKYPKNDLIRETRTEARNLKYNSRKDDSMSC